MTMAVKRRKKRRKVMTQMLMRMVTTIVGATHREGGHLELLLEEVLEISKKVKVKAAETDSFPRATVVALLTAA